MMKRPSSISAFFVFVLVWSLAAVSYAQTPKELGLVAEGTVTHQDLEIRDGKIVWKFIVRIIIRNNGSEPIIFIPPATEAGYHTKASVDMLYQDLGGGVRLPETEERIVFTYTETRENDDRPNYRPFREYVDYDGSFAAAAPPPPIQILSPHDYFEFGKRLVIKQAFITNPNAPTHLFDGWTPDANVPKGMSFVDLPAFRVRFDYSFVKGLKDPYAVGKAKDRWASFGILPTDDNDEMTFTTKRILTPGLPPNDILPSLHERLYGKPNTAERRIELLLTGEDYYENDISASDGETWLGLFAENDEFVVRPATLRISKHVIEAARRINGETGTRKRVAVDGGSEPILLLKNADSIEPGTVTGVIHGLMWPAVFKLLRQGNADAEKLRMPIEEGFTKNFKIGIKSYDLKVARITEGLAHYLTLTLESGEKRQIIHTVPVNSGSLGDLYWVGDLDRDGKPDIFMSLWENDVVHNAALFLSSHADDGQFVKQAANFWTAGE